MGFLLFFSSHTYVLNHLYFIERSLIKVCLEAVRTVLNSLKSSKDISAECDSKSEPKFLFQCMRKNKLPKNPKKKVWIVPFP